METITAANVIDNPELLASVAAFLEQKKKTDAQAKKDQDILEKQKRDDEAKREREELLVELASLGIANLPEAVTVVGLTETKNKEKKIVARHVYVNFSHNDESHVLRRSVKTKGMNDVQRDDAIKSAKLNVISTVMKILA